jgi:peroxiredoxin
MKRLIILLFALISILPHAVVAKGVTEIRQGDHIPAAFAARDATGKQRNYASIRGAKGTVLVFFRSAKWCPFCQAQLKDLMGAQAALAQRGYSLAAISYDDPSVLSGFSRGHAIGYTLLSDAGSKMITAFGLRDPQYAPGSFADGVPKPAIFVINTAGIVLKKMVSTDYRVRPSNTDILAAVEGAR